MSTATLQDFRHLLDRARVRWEEAARVHAAKLAALPTGTCETCLGERVILSGYVLKPTPCPDCCPPVLVARGVPAPFADARLGNFDTPTVEHRRALQFAREMLTIGARDLLLVGGTGVGKSRLAATICNEVVNAKPRKSAMFVRTTAFISGLMPNKPDAHDLESRVHRAAVLAFDDLGSEQASDFSRRVLMAVLEERCDRGLRTVITSNLGLEQLAALHDARLASRLAGRCDIVHLGGLDQRVARRRP